MDVHAEIRNFSESAREKSGFIVARRAEDASLWYYGIYKTADRARRVAIEIENGIVLEKRG